MSTVKFNTNLYREVSIDDLGTNEGYLQITDTYSSSRGAFIAARLDKEELTTLGLGLLEVAGNEGMFITDLPKAKRAVRHIMADDTVKYLDDGDTSDDVLRKAKALLSIYKGMVEIDIENEAKAKAEAERQKKIDAANELNKRRNELAAKFSGRNGWEYAAVGVTAKSAIDYIIEQEEADK